MQCKVSRPMVKLLKENSKFKDLYEFSYEEIEKSLYEMYVDYNIWQNEIDLNVRNGKMKFIKVKYPDEYYACSKCITTKNLNDCLKYFERKGKHFTTEEFIQAFDSMIEI